MPTTDVYEGLRTGVLAVLPAEIGLAPSVGHPHVWGVLTEFGTDNGTATLVALLDGTVSLYTSTGGGVIGLGGHENIREASIRLISSAERYRDDLTRAEEHPLPTSGRVRFYVLTFDGALTADVIQSDVSLPEHRLHQLFSDAQDVLTQIRTTPGTQ